MAREIERLTRTFLKDPAKVEVARRATAAETITQGVVVLAGSRVDSSEKRATLRALIDSEGEACTNAIIFCNRKSEVDVVAKSLKRHGYDAEPIHGDLEQSQRTRTLDLFRDGKLRLLVASDVAARGLDIPAVSHVFNFDVPSHSEDYVHRIGRTGRAGREGRALTISTSKDEKNLLAIEALIERPIPRVENPLGDAPRAERPAPAAPARAPRGSAPREEERPRGPRRDDQRVSRRAEAAPVEAAAPMEAPPEAAPVVAGPARRERSDRAPRPDRDARDRTDRDRSDRDRRPRPEPQAESVVGMGEDVPSFISLSFDERRSA
jgi:superfamily II DNA/RNA helicase